MTTSDTALRIGSLFSGYGGLDIAAQATFGGEVVWYSEIDKAACQVLAAHHPGVSNLGDITAVDWADVPPIDILTGGYPCQPFSHAGKRAGTNDERHLWPYVRDAIAALRPVVTVLENVDGHRSLGLDVVLGDLADMGMSARWGIVRAADAGAPHGRKRIFIIVTDPSREGLQGCSVPAATVHGTRSSGVGTDGSTQSTADAESTSGGQRRCEPRSRQAKSRGSDCGTATDASRGSLAGAAAIADRLPIAAECGDVAPADATGAERGGAQPEHLGAASRSAAEPGERAGTDWGKYAPAITRWESVLGRPAPSPTILGRNGRPRLSPAFVEWMMGLPEGWVTDHGLSASQELKMLGNGVVPQQAMLALRMLTEAVA